ncbi:MAG: hypothetical protein Q8P57_01460 [Candidatus Pacearchaeota archaeon]|nr:hypothetical protein [Candidatus Pacearchaeota archaeon]
MATNNRSSKLEDIAASVAPIAIMAGGATPYVIESFEEGNMLHVAIGTLGMLTTLGLSYIVYRHRTRYTSNNE